jgi:hypothetical protein
VSLTFEYVTDPAMHPWRRVISKAKDAVAYFGFRQVFRRAKDQARHIPGRQRARMTRAATWALSLGVLLFIGLLASQGLPAVIATLALAGWGLLLVALFHLLPLAIDAVAIQVLFGGGAAAWFSQGRTARALGGRICEQPDAGGAARRPGADGASPGTARNAHGGGGRRDHGQHHAANLCANRLRSARRGACSAHRRVTFLSMACAPRR